MKLSIIIPVYNKSRREVETSLDSAADLVHGGVLKPFLLTMGQKAV